MNSTYRYVPVADRSCPEYGRPVTAVCKPEGTGEKYWLACNSSRDTCMWGEQTPTHRSDDERVTRAEVTATFDARYEDEG